MAKSKPAPIDKNQLVVDQLVALLESGVRPWARPWKSTKDSRDYQNLITRKPYSGFNPMFCTISNMSYGYESPFFITMNQARQHGWKVKAGSKSCWIRFAKSGSVEVEGEGENGDSEVTTKGFFYQKWSSVFNLDCIDDSDADVKIQDIIDKPESTPDNPDTLVPSIDRFLSAIGGNVEYGGDRAAYSPTADKIVLPHWKQFKSAATAYATAIHEYSHWTGHKSRLDRPGITQFAGFGSKSYAREELIAEISSAMLTAQLYPEYSGVELEHHAAYLSSWLSGLKAEPEAFFTALTQAQKACKLLIELGSRDVPVSVPAQATITAPAQAKVIVSQLQLSLSL